MKYILFILAIGIFVFAVVKLSRYEERMKEYNHHMCVEVYGLNEECK